MNKSPEERGLDPFVQAHKRSPRVFLKFLKFLDVKRNLYEISQVGQRSEPVMCLCGIFLRNKTP